MAGHAYDGWGRPGPGEAVSSLARLYRALHARPEPAFEEHRTAAEIAERCSRLGYAVTDGVGRTGVVATLANGPGPTVLLTAGLDAPQITELTGLPWSSVHDGVMHAHGHDMHMVCLLGAMRALTAGRARWRGRLLCLFQPATETGRGAQALLGDGLYERFGRPAAALGQRLSALPPGTLGCRPGQRFAASDILSATVYGTGPDSTPTALATAIARRLRGIPDGIPDPEIAQVGAGVFAILPESLYTGADRDSGARGRAHILINARTFQESVRTRVLSAIVRAIHLEALSAGTDRAPEIRQVRSLPGMGNDPLVTARTLRAFAARGMDVVRPERCAENIAMGQVLAATDTPACFWLLGGGLVMPDASPDGAGAPALFCAPALIEPTITTGVRALTAAATRCLGAAA
ncbi:M20/M25/M40 family metallo-hydrolase [Streptomyces sp. LaPpAH-108]|uniref:M20/M25/M40 family metallo-hydrolase n=1 Tax=Streptomyces sp. LaPpAH-108 TaxID=1155714 RepID=UPI000372E75B|nr:M20/M25/M40 family metallo-hydrolase [Streptomyces sp. LaPpAH-108]